MSNYLKTLDNVQVENRRIIIQHDKLVFQFHMFQTNIDVFLSECFHCPLDCNKLIDLFIGNTNFEDETIADLEPDDLLLLAHVKDFHEKKFPFASEDLEARLKSLIHFLKFGIIGFDQVGKSTLFEMIPGKPKKVNNLINTYTKEIISFSPLIIKVYDYGKDLMENLSSKSPAPMLLDNLRNFYLFIIVTDSSPQNVTGTKNQIIPKLKVSPFAAKIVIANKSDLPNRLSPDLIEKIFGERTYPLSALNPDSAEFFIKMLNEVILLRQEQMQEYNCPFLKINS